MQQNAKQKSPTIRDEAKLFLIDRQLSPETHLQPIWFVFQHTSPGNKLADDLNKTNKRCPTVFCHYHPSVVLFCLLFRRLCNKTVFYCLPLTVALVRVIKMQWKGQSLLLLVMRFEAFSAEQYQKKIIKRERESKIYSLQVCKTQR